jgi:spoIIIJ-associated protein
MTRTVRATGDHLEGALQRAVAELLASEPEKVELRLEAPGLDDLTGEFRLELDVASPAPVDTPASSPTDAVASSPTDAVASSPTDAVASSPADAALEGTPEEVRTADEDGHGSDGDDESSGEPELTAEDLDEEADAAADFLEGLLDAMDLPGDLRIKVHSDHAEIEVVELGSGALIGRRGQTLEAIQELVRCSLQRQFQRRARVKVDAEGYRARRLEKLLEKAEEAIDAVLESGEAERLEPMDVFERKAVHQFVGGIEGVQSRSQGREPARRIVIERT